METIVTEIEIIIMEIIEEVDKYINFKEVG